MIKATKLKKKYDKLKIAKWSFLGILIILFILSNHYYIKHSNIFQNILLTSLTILSTGLIFLTKSGKKFLIFTKSAIHETKLITWPNFKDTLHVTFTVIIVTILLALILWGLDNILIWFISLITSLRL
ncbi:preprotein translocase SecE subunit [Buchnera aphidicola str. Bp (Baizongia pistaciae)]|uniref:Protein translocase subunit SecE n=1 Tax=Buchnera aphidicola subsp. Baizongia pistaciae (strain Bp) TaxID=224915 RepID=SECE_BUCBP|nr:RecName: Full=Protein translocase subunit SecE [Buchnera aphidicola str. Bp (Baizongia pistaciae)]AAO26784.1 preprotein translocase SecE subunit [Buchnera aphidicola str. Bp (Baizongia pistaciae)]